MRHWKGEAPRRARWTLRADGNRGPYVPTLAMLRRLRDGNAPFPGARPCSGILSLDDFSSDLAALAISTGRA